MNNEATFTNGQDKKMANSFTKIPAAIIIGSLSLLVFLLLPAYIGSLSEHSFNDSELGYIASMDLAGITLISLLSTLFINKINWRNITIISLIGLAVFNLLCINQTDYKSLLILRLCSGISAGMVIVVVYSVLSASADPDRSIAIFVVVQVLFQSIGFLTLPMIAGEAGSTGFYYLFAVAAGLSVILAPWLPSQRHDENPAHKSNDKTRLLPTFMVLVSMTLFFLGQGAIWGFGELIGSDGGLSSEDISLALALTSLTALLGAGLAAWMSNHYGRFWPILIAILVQLAALFSFHGEMSFTYFLIVFSIFSFGWNFGISFQVGVLVDVDPEGRFASLVPAFQGAGLALGPALAGALLTGESYYYVNMTSFIALVLYLVLILPYSYKRIGK